MDEDKSSRFISSLVKSIQALCNGFVDFSTSIEVIGHIHLNIDRNVKLDYVLTEEVSKSASEGSTVFASHSYHSQSPSSVASKNTNDTSNHGQKSRKDNETDPLGLSALPREVPNTSKSDSQSSNRVGDNRNSSHTSSGSVGFSRNSDSETLRHERSSFQVEDSTNKRRKIGPFSQSNPHPAAKRNRPNDFGSDSRTVVKESGFEVIEIKEEPDEDVPAVFFGGSSSGQDIQTPDFSNVVMESLDRVSQLEQNTDLAGEGGDGMGEYKQPVFPVMFHQGDGMSSSAGGRLPGPSSDSQAIASTSGDAQVDSKAAASGENQNAPSPSPSSTSPQTASPTTTTTVTAPTTIATTTTPISPTLTPMNPSTSVIANTSLGSSFTSQTLPPGSSSSQLQSPYAIPPRPLISIPPISPKYKPEDLPPDTKQEDVARLTECHVLERVPPTEKKKYPSKRCKVCLRRSGYGPGPARKHPKESVYFCPQCPSKPGLCCYPCYYVYHSKMNFWEPDEGEEQGGSGGGSVAGRSSSASYPDSRGGGVGVYGGVSGLQDAPGGGSGQRVHHTPLVTSSYSGASALAQAAHAIGRAMQLDSSALYGSGAMIDEDEHEQKFCPMPMYGESLYGPGGQ